jgi:hypothetical protein
VLKKSEQELRKRIKSVKKVPFYRIKTILAKSPKKWEYLFLISPPDLCDFLKEDSTLCLLSGERSSSVVDSSASDFDLE